MSILRVEHGSFDASVFEGSSCAFGVFDGVHRGHRFLIDSACLSARKTGGKAIALTFDIDPDEKFHPDRLKKLLSNEDRLRVLSESGVDDVVVLPFTDRFASSSPEDFLARTFGGHAPAFLHVGEDFRFGARARGTIAELREWSESSGTQVVPHGLLIREGSPITATRIRRLLADCDLDAASDLLGYDYFLREKVERGRGEGTDMGFSTANLKPGFAFRVLGEGVYAAYATVAGNRYRAAASVGVSPVFRGQTDSSCEVHILDFDGDIYDEEITVTFMKYLRPMIDFRTTEELISTVKGNIDWVRENLPL